MTNRIPILIAFAIAVVTAPLSAQVAPPPSTPDAPKNLAPVRSNQAITTNALLGFVNSEPIFVHDLLRPIDEKLRSSAKTARNLNEFRDAARAAIADELQSTVSNILVLSSAKAALTDESKGIIDLYVNKQRADLLAKYAGSRALADQALKAEGSSVERYLAAARRGFIVQLFLSKQIFPKVVVTRNMILDEYTRNPKNWQEDPELELFTITLPISRWLREPDEKGERGPVIKNPTPAQIKAAEAKALAEATDITNKLKASKDIVKDFGLLAEDKGSVDGRAFKGGRTGNVKRGSRVSEKEEDYIFSLPADTLGEPLLLEDADFMKSRVEIIRVGEKKEGRTIPFSEAQAAIKEKLEDQQFEQLKNEHMKELYKRAAIEGVNRMAETALDVAIARYATQ